MKWINLFEKKFIKHFENLNDIFRAEKFEIA